jgi:hypothetical protein
MPAPSSYSEGALAEYLVDDLGDVASALGWTTDTIQVVRAVYDTLRAYGVETIAEVEDMAKLEALGKRAVWRAAVKSLSTRYDIRAGDQTLNRSQMFKQVAETNLAQAEAEAAAYDTTSSVVRVGSVVHDEDPYSGRFLSEQTGW